MLGETFQSVDVNRVQHLLAKLHDSIGGGRTRVELTQEGCDHVCVMICKSELEALERALEILTESNEYKAMCDEVAQVAAATSVLTPQYAPAGQA